MPNRILGELFTQYMQKKTDETPQLNESGKIMASYLPSYVDDVIEGYLDTGVFYSDAQHQNSITAENGKIYVDNTTNKTYRWSGSAYVEVSESLALGETAATAYRGDRGAAAYAAAVTNVDSTPTTNSMHLVTSGGVAAAINNIEGLPEVSVNDNGKSLEVVSGEWVVGNEKINKKLDFDLTFESKTWNGFTNFSGSNIWSDGNNIYYSFSSDQYVLDKSTSTWSAKTWTGLTDLNRNYIWSDGDNVYYSNFSSHYVLDKSTSTWSTKTWGLSFNGDTIWSDGDHIYSSNGTAQYVLDTSTSTWSAKTWTGLTSFYANYVWTDGENIYYSNNSEQYVLDKSTSTWSEKTWSGLTSFQGSYIWTDGNNTYNSRAYSHYILDKATSTWIEKTLVGLRGFMGNDIWSDGNNIYYSSDSSNQYRYVQPSPQILLTSNGEFIPVALNNILPSTMSGASASTAGESGLVPIPESGEQALFLRGDATWATPINTQNTAGATDTSDKIFIVGAKSQGANPQTYSHDTAYVGTDGCLYSDGTKVLTAHQDISGKKDTQSAVSDPSASGNALAFIDTISQNAQGVITPTKKTIADMSGASASAAGTHGLVPAPANGDQNKFLRGDGTWNTVPSPTLTYNSTTGELNIAL